MLLPTSSKELQTTLKWYAMSQQAKRKSFLGRSYVWSHKGKSYLLYVQCRRIGSLKVIDKLKIIHAKSWECGNGKPTLIDERDKSNPRKSYETTVHFDSTIEKTFCRKSTLTKVPKKLSQADTMHRERFQILVLDLVLKQNQRIISFLYQPLEYKKLSTFKHEFQLQ